MMEEEQKNFFAYLLYFKRRGASTWLGHLDMMRLFERALRRAGYQQRWSQGFNPRPEMVFALPLAVGIDADDEWLEIELVEEIDPEEIPSRLNPCLISGLEVHRARAIAPQRKSLMSLVKEAVYLVEAEGVADAFAQMMQTDGDLIVEREHKGKVQIHNIREKILDWEKINQNIFRFRCFAGSKENLRPDLVLNAVEKYTAFPKDLLDDAQIVREKLIFEERVKERF